MRVVSVSLAQPDEPAPFAGAPYDYNVWGEDGQSNAVAEQGIPYLTLAPLGNLKLLDSMYNPAGGPTFYTVADVPALLPRLSLSTLTVPLRATPTAIVGSPPYQPPANISGRTGGLDLVNQLTTDTGWISVMTNPGITSVGIAALKKNGTAYSYANLLYEVAAIKSLSDAQGKTCGMIGIFWRAGEADWFVTTYAAQVAQLRNDLDADVKAITGQDEDIVFVIPPQNTNFTIEPAQATIAIFALVTTEPRHFIGIAVYQYPYASDGIHFTSQGQIRNGEKAAIQYSEHRASRLGGLYATGATLLGSVITVSFAVPYLPLQWSTSVYAPHPGTPEWAAGKGFEVVTSLGVKITIASVAIVGSTVVITCSTPPGAGSVVSAALYQDSTGFHGGQSGGRGCLLCDSMVALGYTAQTIACNVVNGSASITCFTAGDFGFRDRSQFAVAASWLTSGSYIVSVTGDTIVLSSTWSGTSGVASILFYNDHRNYALPFSLTL